MDIEGKASVLFGSGNSCDLGVDGETTLICWVEELYLRGWPPEWGDVHAAAKNIAQSQGLQFCSLKYGEGARGGGGVVR